MFKDKLKFFIKEDENNIDNKKKIENLIFLIVVIIITIVIINYIWAGNKKSNKTIINSAEKKLATTQTNIDDSNYTNKDILEKGLEEILDNIDGVEKVKVFINYSESSEAIVMYNENSKTSITEEKDTSGGIRKIEQTDSEKEIVYEENNGSKVPIIQKTVKPKIEGVIITAKGVSNINVKTNIIQAVEAATGIATHKIQVFEGS